jgi:zinc transporter, ZIP family
VSSLPAPHVPAWRRPRRCIGAAVAAAGLWLLALETVQQFTLLDGRIAGALVGGLVAAAATAAGTLPVLLSQRISQRCSDALLGFGAGVMLAATSFSLIIPALETARERGAGAWAAAAVVGGGILLGGLFLRGAERWLPSGWFEPAGDSAQARALKRAWLFVLAISLHNVPEGLAIGVAFAGQDAGHARALATGISLQDVPEGLVVALALRGVGHGRLLSVGLGAASGLVEPVASVLGAVAVTIAGSLLPWGLAFAAGAMLFAVSHEVIPGSHEKGNAGSATTALMLGFVLMMVLDTALA